MPRLGERRKNGEQNDVAELRGKGEKGVADICAEGRDPMCANRVEGGRSGEVGAKSEAKSEITVNSEAKSEIMIAKEAKSEAKSEITVESEAKSENMGIKKAKAMRMARRLRPDVSRPICHQSIHSLST